MFIIETLSSRTPVTDKRSAKAQAKKLSRDHDGTVFVVACDDDSTLVAAYELGEDVTEQLREMGA